MVSYKYSKFFSHTNNSAFDTTTGVGQRTPYSGIYRCIVCGHQIVSTIDHPMPPQNHHQHPKKEPIEWQLIASAH